MASTTPMFLAALGLLCAFIPFPAANSDAISYSQCSSNAQCAPEHCCVLSPIRYSVPQCKPMQAEGEACRPTPVDTTLNFTLVYPDGTKYNLTDVHYVVCPCASGFSCDRKEGICKSDGQNDLNQVDGEKDGD